MNTTSVKIIQNSF